MKLGALLLACPLACFAQQPHQEEIQRALIHLDQRSAEFARGAPPAPLDPRAGQPLHPDPELARQLRPYERLRAAQEERERAARAREDNVLRLPPPMVQKDETPLALPGGPRAGVDPVTAPGVRN